MISPVDFVRPRTPRSGAPTSLPSSHPILAQPRGHELEGFGAMADRVFLRRAELAEGAVFIGRHEEGIVAEAFGADLGFEDLAPALPDEFADFLIRPEECEVTFKTRATLMERGLLHRLKELRAILCIGRTDAGVDRGVDARSALQRVAAQSAVVGEDPGFARGDRAQGFALQPAVAVEGAGDLFHVRHAAEFLRGTHADVEARLGEHPAEFLGLMCIARRQKDIHGGNVSTWGWEGKG